MLSLKIYGFPRSGNNLLMHLVALNFMPSPFLKPGPPSFVGHWNDRQKVIAPRYHQHLFGGHGPPAWYDKFWNHSLSEYPFHPLYIFRDGRSVIASLYNSLHFKNPDQRSRLCPSSPLSFSEFIRAPIDWVWSTGIKRTSALTEGQHSATNDGSGTSSPNVIQHWYDHLNAWRDTKLTPPVPYESVVKYPTYVLENLMMRFDLASSRQYTPFKPVDKLVGWFPSSDPHSTFMPSESPWSDDDLEFFFSIVPHNFYGLIDW